MRVLVLGAAGSAADNYTKCIRDEHHVVGADVNGALLPLSCAHETVVLETRPEDAGHLDEIRQTCLDHDIDFVHAAPDQETLFLSKHRTALSHIGVKTLVPWERVVMACQDKLKCAVLLGDLAPESAVWYPRSHTSKVWLRLRSGAGSAGAVLSRDERFSAEWVAHWNIDPAAWMISEYLPGPDRSWTGVFRDGKLVARGMRERVQYMNAARSATGQTSTYQVGRLIHDDELDALCTSAVRTIDVRPNGWYYVDTKGHADGRQLVTEINAGRPNTTVDAWAQAGLNLPLIALDPNAEVTDYQDGTYLRQPDMGSKFIPAGVASWR